MTIDKSDVVAEALMRAKGNTRWQNAFLKATEAFLGDDSSTFQEAVERCRHYKTTIVGCECPAGTHGHACKHQAFLRLLAGLPYSEDHVELPEEVTSKMKIVEDVLEGNEFKNDPWVIEEVVRVLAERQEWNEWERAVITSALFGGAADTLPEAQVPF